MKIAKSASISLFDCIFDGLKSLEQVAGDASRSAETLVN